MPFVFYSLVVNSVHIHETLIKTCEIREPYLIGYLVDRFGCSAQKHGSAAHAFQIHELFEG
jgi:hypothetical protein